MVAQERAVSLSKAGSPLVPAFGADSGKHIPSTTRSLIELQKHTRYNYLRIYTGFRENCFSD